MSWPGWPIGTLAMPPGASDEQCAAVITCVGVTREPVHWNARSDQDVRGVRVLTRRGGRAADDGMGGSADAARDGQCQQKRSKASHVCSNDAGGNHWRCARRTVRSIHAKAQRGRPGATGSLRRAAGGPTWRETRAPRSSSFTRSTSRRVPRPAPSSDRRGVTRSRLPALADRKRPKGHQLRPASVPSCLRWTAGSSTTACSTGR
jgi:hypothetical protein